VGFSKPLLLTSSPVCRNSISALLCLLWQGVPTTVTVYCQSSPRRKAKQYCVIAGLKALRLVHVFRGPLKELTNAISGLLQAQAKNDGFSNNKRSNSSNTHPLKSTILIPERGPTPGWVCRTKRRAKCRAKHQCTCFRAKGKCYFMIRLQINVMYRI
jgi:hypothetical protein